MTMLEKESSLQQIKIQQLEGEDWPRVKVMLEAIWVWLGQSERTG